MELERALAAFLLSCASCEKCTVENAAYPVLGHCAQADWGINPGMARCLAWEVSYSKLENFIREKGENQMMDAKTVEMLTKMGINADKVQNIVQHVPTSRWDIKHGDIVNIPVVVLGIEEIETVYGRAILGRVIVNGEEKQCLFGATVLVTKLLEAQDKLPLLVVVRKVGKYYDFVE